LRRLASPIIALLAALAVAGCETLSYYMQAIGGQMSLMSSAQPVAELLADPATPPVLRDRLAAAQAIRDFSVKVLKLPDNASYRSYAELGRPYAVWNVVATAEFSLSPVQSCFPVAGCVNYRGFFSQEAAERYAAGLREAGHDVFVYGVPAYSTLGRFDDPLLSSFIRYPDVELARLVFHELSHQVVYVKDDSTFNESFAVAVEREAVRRWLATTGRSAELEGFLRMQRDSAAMMAEFDAVRAKLKALYSMPLSAERMREGKRAELAAFKRRLEANPRYAKFEPSNALLASFATYTQMVPMFEKILAEEGGDLEKFYARVRKVASEPPGARGALSPVPASAQSNRDPSSKPSP
jgi:predicted aminopeptidase